MTAFPDSSSTPNTKSLSNLKAGLTAFKEGNYPEAIALLEPVVATPIDHPLLTKAQMGLVLAYERVGESQKAANLSHLLLQSADPQLQAWASQTLTALLQRHPEITAPSDLAAPEPTSATAETVSTENVTGFIPLKTVDPAIAPRPEPETSGFITSAPEALVQSPPESTGFVTAQPGEPTRQSPPASRPPRFTKPPQLRTSSPPGETSSDRRSQPWDGSLEASPCLYQPVWRLAGRAQQWKPLGKVNIWRLVGLEILTVLAFYWVIEQLLYQAGNLYGNALNRVIPMLGFRWVLWGSPHWTVPLTITLLGTALLASRWILDGLLIGLYGLKPLSLDGVGGYSPETARSLPQFCRQHRLPVPAFGLLPTQAPVAFTYGPVPWLTRTVVSQGLLEQLSEEEIATVFAQEVGHLAHWDVPVMSMIAVLVQLPYTLYRIAADWGDRKSSPLTKASANLIAALSYGLFRLLRWLGLGLSRQRVYYSDRVAADLTGNPNAYTRALLKIAIGTAEEIQAQSKTNYLLEGMDLLAPSSHGQAVPLGSVFPHTPIAPLLEQERTNPYLPWLSINQSHPVLGDRLHLLTLYARHWKLEEELNWPETSSKSSRIQRYLTGTQWRTLLLQAAPFFGIALGAAIALLLYLLGRIGLHLRQESIMWLYTDWANGSRTILRGMMLIGFSLGTIIRLNRFFPELQRRLTTPRTYPELLQQSGNLPLNNQPVSLSGKLLGRSGIGNHLNQDLWLQTATGVVKLHCTSRFGPLGDLLPQSNRPSALVQQDLTVIGWFRRGATPWIDVETLRTSGGRVSRSDHPAWSALVAAIAALAGVITILNF
jgi:Zn-dependent protease with chaperone function